MSMDTNVNEKKRNKSLDEQLFEQLMRAPHEMRAKMRESRGEGRPEGCGRHGGPGCKEGGPGCGRHGRPPFGPGRPGGTAHLEEPRRPHDHRGPGCGGPGPHGPEGPHDPNHERRRRRRRAMLARERVLGIVLEAEDGIRQKDIAAQMHIGPSALSEMITKLEIAGYLERKVDPTDKRATLISLTEVGQARAYELQDERAERFGKLFGKLNDEEKAQLLALLEKLNAPDEAEADPEDE